MLFKSVVRTSAALLAVLGAACGDITSSEGGLWEYREGRDQTTNIPYARASVGFGLNTLFVECKDRQFSVYASFPFVLESNTIRYRFDEETGVTETWTNSTNYKALFYPRDARAFARRIAASNRMYYEVRKYAAGPESGSWNVEGLEAHLSKIESTCAN